MKNLSSVLLCLLALAGCQSMPPAPDGISQAHPTQEAAPGWPNGQRYLIDQQASKLRLIVRAEGAMAHIGHPHVIGGSVIGGEVVLADPFHDSALRLTVHVDDLQIDQGEWLQAEGFESDVDESDIAATRRNMLSPEQLDAESHPEIRIESIGITGPRWQPDIEALVTLAGETRRLTVPIALAMADDRLIAIGRFAIRQSDFGLTPYSAAGGALWVSDEVLIRFRIEARASG